MRDPVAFSTEDFRPYQQDNPELILRDDGSVLVTYDSIPDPFGGVFYEMSRLIGQSWNPATGSVGSEFLLTSQTGEVFAGSSSLSIDPLTERDIALFKALTGQSLLFIWLPITSIQIIFTICMRSISPNLINLI